MDMLSEGWAGLVFRLEHERLVKLAFLQDFGALEVVLDGAILGGLEGLQDHGLLPLVLALADFINGRWDHFRGTVLVPKHFS